MDRFADSWVSPDGVACGTLKIGSIFFGSSGFSLEVKAYSHIILSCCLNGVAKSFMFLRATRIAGSSFLSMRVLFCFNFRRASCSIDFRFSVWSSSFCSWPGMKYSGDAPTFMWDVLICFVSRSSERIADAKTGSISIVFAIRTGRDGPAIFRKEIIFCFFCWMFIMWFRI